jgi:hypothetical protein
VLTNSANSYFCETHKEIINIPKEEVSRLQESRISQINYKYQKLYPYSHMDIIRHARKPTKRLLKSLCPSVSVCTHETSRERIHRFWLNLILEDFTKKLSIHLNFGLKNKILTTTLHNTINTSFSIFVIHRNTFIGNTIYNSSLSLKNS